MRERRRVKGRSTRVKVCKRSGTVLTRAGHRVDPRVAVLPWQLTAGRSEEKGGLACRFSARHLFCGAPRLRSGGLPALRRKSLRNRVAANRGSNFTSNSFDL